MLKSFHGELHGTGLPAKPFVLMMALAGERAVLFNA